MLTKEEMLAAAEVAEQYPLGMGSQWMSRGPINDDLEVECLWDEDYRTPFYALVEPNYAVAAVNEYPAYRKYG
jgi:hypothetical protein